MNSKDYEELSNQELKMVTGGKRIISSNLNNENVISYATNNKYCRKCGFVTPHHPTANGKYACIFCACTND